MRWSAILVLAILLSPLALASRADMYIFAVTEEGKGMAAKLVVEVKPGSGNISLTLNAIVGEDTQRSITNAIRAATREANRDFYKYDYVVTINSSAEYVSGPSAGLPIALATYAALLNRDVPDDVSATGTIDEEGYVGPVGGIYEKLMAAKDVGIRLFLIPRGERYVEITTEEETEPGVVSPTVKTVDVVEVGREYNISVYEVSTLKEAIAIVFKGFRPNQEANRPLEAPIEVNFIPQPFKTHYGEVFRPVVESLVEDLNKELGKNCKHPFPGYDSIKRSAESYYSRAVLVLDRGYLYTAGNYAFLALGLIGAANLICEHPSMRNPHSLAFELYETELRNRLEELEMRAQKAVPTTSNMELLGGARQRILRALFVLEHPLPEDPFSALQSLKNVEYWLKTAEMLLDMAEEKNGGAEITGIDQVARDEIVAAEDMVMQLHVTPPQRLAIAREAFRRGWYVAAFIEAALAKGEVLSDVVERERIGERIRELLERLENPRSLWAEVYKAHGLYYLGAAESYREAGLAEKAEEMERTALLMLEAASDITVLGRIAVTPVVHVKKEEKNTLPIIIAFVLFLFALIALSMGRSPLAHVPREKREEARQLLREIKALEKVKKLLDKLSSQGNMEAVEKERKRIERDIERLKKRFERLLEPSPPRGSSRRARGRRR